MLQVDVRKDLTQLYTGMERLERTSDQWRQEMREELKQDNLSYPNSEGVGLHRTI